MARPRLIRFDVDSLGTYSAPQSSINVNLRKLAAMGGKKKEGQILKVARLWLIVPITFDANSATLSGVISGRRFYEIVSNVQVAPAGWPVDYSHDCSGKILRLQHVILHGHLAANDPIDAADDDHADTAKRLIIPINFWRDRAVRPEDFCPAAVHVGEGSMQFAIQELQISGVSDEKIASGCKVLAECFYGDPEVPIFTRLRERTIGTTIQRFDLNVVADRLASAFMHIQWSQAAGTDHLEGTFDESRTVQLELDGTRHIEDFTIQELVETNWNAQVVAHGGWKIPTAEYNTGGAIPNTGVNEDPTVPTILPLFENYGWGEKNTKLPRATMDSFIEFSGQLQDTATGTGRPYALVTDEFYEPKRGHKNVEEYLRAGKADGPIEMSRKTESKADFVAAHKAGAVPLKVKPLAKLTK